MFEFNASFLDENGNDISIDPLNNSSLLIDQIGKNVGFNNVTLNLFFLFLKSVKFQHLKINQVHPLESFVSSSSVTDSHFYVFLTLYISVTICAGQSSLSPLLIRGKGKNRCFSGSQRLPHVSDNKKDRCPQHKVDCRLQKEGSNICIYPPQDNAKIKCY